MFEQVRLPAAATQNKLQLLQVVRRFGCVRRCLAVTSSAGAVLSLGALISEWVEALERQLNRSEPVPQFEHGWREVALEYERLYRRGAVSRLQAASNHHAVIKPNYPLALSSGAGENDTVLF